MALSAAGLKVSFEGLCDEFSFCCVYSFICPMSRFLSAHWTCCSQAWVHRLSEKVLQGAYVAIVCIEIVG